MVNDIFWSEIGSGFRRTGQYTLIRNSQEYPSTPSCQMTGFWLLFSVIIDLIYNNSHLYMQFLRTDGIKVRPHGFSGGKYVIKSANKRNLGQAYLFYTEENTQLFVSKRIMASHGWNSPLTPFWMR